MTFPSLSASNDVVCFATRAAGKAPQSAGLGLTLRDRMDVTAWQDRARDAGFDRMVIHERDPNDAAEVTAFLMVHRRGQAWARWAFTRTPRGVLAWCCLTGLDVGYFDTLPMAFRAVLENNGAHEAPPVSAGTLVPFLRPSAGSGLRV